MNIFVLAQLIPTFLLHLLFAAAVVSVLFFLSTEFKGLTNMSVSISVGMLLLLVSLLVPSGWSYIFSSGPDFQTMMANAKAIVPAPELEQYVVADIVGCLIGAIGTYVFLCVRSLSRY